MLQITTKIGDSPLLAIPLVVDVHNDSTAFSPGAAYTLLLTAKTKLTDLDAAAKFQLALGAGLTVSGSVALCQLAPTATVALATANLYWDIRATHIVSGDTHIIAEGRWRLERPATRLPASSIAIYTVQPFAGFVGLGTLATQSGTFSGTSSGVNTGDQTNISGNAGTATKLATARTISGQPFDGTANVAISASNVGAVATTGNETVAGSKTLSGQLQLTGQVASDANSAMTVGMAFLLRPALRGTAWDFVTGGFPAQLGPLAAIGGYYGAAFGPILTSVYPSAPVLAGNIISWLSVTYGLALMCDKTGVDKSNAVGAWFGSNGSPANFYPNPFTAPPSKSARVMRLIIPISFNRTGRRYGLTSANTYANQTVFFQSLVWLRFSSTSNALECLVCTAYPSTFAAVQTASGAVGNGVTGTFTAYSISDSTRDMLVRETVVGATTTIEIAPYSSSPVWSTVLSITFGGFAMLAPSVCCDGTNSGAANNYDQALVINECWEAAKL